MSRRRGAGDASFSASYLVGGCRLGPVAHFLVGGGHWSLFHFRWTVTSGSERIGQLRRLWWFGITRPGHSCPSGRGVSVTVETRVEVRSLWFHQRGSMTSASNAPQRLCRW
jgi:hypothetical protein